MEQGSSDSPAFTTFAQRVPSPAVTEPECFRQVRVINLSSQPDHLPVFFEDRLPSLRVEVSPAAAWLPGQPLRGIKRPMQVVGLAFHRLSSTSSPARGCRWPGRENSRQLGDHRLGKGVWSRWDRARVSVRPNGAPCRRPRARISSYKPPQSPPTYWAYRFWHHANAAVRRVRTNLFIWRPGV